MEFSTLGRTPMIRVRNPWGNEREWTGCWSDNSIEWRRIPENEKQDLGLTFEDDGEFWMSFSDWKNNFNKLEICNLSPDSLKEDEGKQWKVTSVSGEWIPRVNAGGCRNYIDTFWTNPQYKVTLVDPDDDDDDLCTLVVSVLQKDRRRKRNEGLDFLNIGYSIYKLRDNEDASGPLDIDFFQYNKSCARSPLYKNMREVSGRHKLSPGNYVVVPTTFHPNEKGEFLIRLFSEKPNISREMDEETRLVQEKADEDEKKREEEEEKVLKTFFGRIAGEDTEIDANELIKILNVAFKRDFKTSGFDMDCCHSMVALHDLSFISCVIIPRIKLLRNVTELT